MEPPWLRNTCPALLALITIWPTLLVTVRSSLVIEKYACFNTVFEIACGEDENIVFETARYGRNDTGIAVRCLVPYQRNCDIDVHFPLNGRCAGKHRCSLAVNTALFGDPCGYEEFLRVTYKCVQVMAPGCINVKWANLGESSYNVMAPDLGRSSTTSKSNSSTFTVRSIHRACFGPNGPTLYDSGFISSPNYPGKYYMDAECRWKISVQKRQTVRLTIFDFELDVKKAARCSDYLEISAGNRVYFKDCGSLGKQIIDVDDNTALLRFSTGETSLTQRGFFIYFEAIGPGCPDLEDLKNGQVDYFIEDDVLFANASCDEGFVFSGTQVSLRQIRCASGSYWSSLLVPCVAPTPTTPVPATTTNTKKSTQNIMDRSGSLVDGDSHIRHISIALGVVSAILLITLLLVLALYFHRRRRNAELKLDQWRVVINNLQESAMNEENLKRQDIEDGPNLSPGCNIRRAKRKNKKNKNNREDEWQGCNLLGSQGYDDEEMVDYIDHRDMETSAKYADPDECRCGSRRNSVRGKYYLTRSRDSQLDGPGGGPPIWADDFRGPRKPTGNSRRDLRHKRARSGQWDNNRPILAPTPTTQLGPEKKLLTQSAPDLLEMVRLSRSNVGVARPEDHYVVPQPIVPNNHSFPAHLARSSTLGAVPAQKYVRPPVPNRTNSRGKIRC